MRWTTLGVATTLLGSYCADAANFPRAVKGDGFLAVPVGAVARPKKSSKRADDGAIVTTLDNRDFFYATDISIGTPPQTVTVLVDTGSDELWVNPDCDTAPAEQQYQQCLSFGQYNPDKSKTPPVGPYGSEELRYGDASDSTTRTSVEIRYYRDTLSFGDAEIKNQTFGVVTRSDGISQGILGLAPNLQAGFDTDEPYSLVLSSMASEGLIASRVFALDLRHSDDETGAVIYGGLDRSRFIGKLESTPIIRGVHNVFRLAVRLTGIGLTVQGDAQEIDLDGDDTNVMLDSGTSISRMHYAAAFPILDALNAQDDGEGYYYTDCSYRDQDGGVDFVFGDKTIQVSFSDFILDVGSSTDCYVGVVVTTDQQILGDTVLRAGYFVFDWDNEEVHIAQAATCGDSDIVAVGSGQGAVPDVTGNCKADDDAKSGKGPKATTTNTNDAATLQTLAYTTTFTVTSCHLFDLDCQTGVVTTQTVGPAEPTVTVTAPAGGSGSGDDDDDSAALQPLAISWVFVVVGAFAVGYNLV